MRRCIVVAVVLMVFLPPLSASDSSDQQAAIKRLEQAVSKTNIFELSSFQMKASLQMDSQGKLVDGTYQLLWNGPDQWRQEITFPGYTEIQVGGKGSIWIHRSLDFIPPRIQNLYGTLGFGSSSLGPAQASFVQTAVTAGDTIKKTHSRKEHGDKLTCTQIENQLKISSEICVNDNTGMLVRGSSYQDSDFAAVGGKTYPRSLSFVEDGNKVVKVNITELSTPAQFPASSFAPPPGVSPQAGCMNPIPPELIKKVQPDYPYISRQNHVQGTVYIDTSIGVDGIPSINKVISSPSPELEKSSLDAVSKWRYEPATCNGKPLQLETVLTVNYWLSH